MPDEIRWDWQLDEIRAVYDLPLLDLVFRAASASRQHNQSGEVQICKLISVKTGGCPENCAYCSQSAWYQTGIEAEPMMDLPTVIEIGRRAKENGVSRICLGAAWREVRDDSQFDHVLEMVTELGRMGVEVCCTLGMLTESQAKRLEQAGLYAYNHNLDTSEPHYRAIITTRSGSTPC
jgi:biotin synthase